MSEQTEGLPDRFDAVILGTGLCESVLAAAFSRIGYSVLHLDRNTYYGELQATHSLNGLLDYAKLHSEGLTHSTVDHPAVDGEVRIALDSDSSPSVTNMAYQTYNISDEERKKYQSIIDWERRKLDKADDGSAAAKESTDELPEGEPEKSQTVTDPSDEVKTEEDVQPELPPIDLAMINPVIKLCIESANGEGTEADHKLDYLKKRSNRFILDLTPKLLFARSEMVDLLITSDVARYCEFRTITQILTMKADKSLQVVPCNRSDIFSTKSLSMIEKRILMKLLTLCMNYETHQSVYEEYSERPFADFLRSQKLTPNLINYVVHAIAMVSESTPTLRSLERTQLFLKSLGRYGPTPFLWPLYGGEINQAFCRMSAVFGGVYILHRTIKEIVVNEAEESATHVHCNEGMQIKCKWLICNPDYMKSITTGDSSRSLSRAIVIASGSLSRDSDKEEAVLLSIPASDGVSDCVHAIELGPAACVCPKDPPNLRVTHLTMKSKDMAQKDLQPYVEQLFCDGDDSDKPRLLLACYFNVPDYSEERRLLPNHPKNLYITSGPDSNINPDLAIVQAKKIFTKICPGEEFLPRPPNPEDIIYCDDQSKKQSAGESFSEEVIDTDNVSDRDSINDTHKQVGGDDFETVERSSGEHDVSIQSDTKDQVVPGKEQSDTAAELSDTK